MDATPTELLTAEIRAILGKMNDPNLDPAYREFLKRRFEALEKKDLNKPVEVVKW
jgi:hypothetical protein